MVGGELRPPSPISTRARAHVPDSTVSGEARAIDVDAYERAVEPAGALSAAPGATPSG